MKKIATILMLVAVILVGGMTAEAKTTKKKAKARTTRTIKSKIPEGAFAMFKIRQDEKFYLINDGEVEGTIKNEWFGKFAENNGAYILAIVHDIDGHAAIFGVIYNNTFYMFTRSDYDPDFWDYFDFWEYYWDHPYDFNNWISFNPETLTITYKTNYGSNSKSLSIVPADDRFSVSWLK